MTRTALALALISACGASAAPDVAPTSSATAPATTTPLAATPPPPPAGACVISETARAACAARGAGFEYGPMDDGFCGGAEPPPDVVRRRSEMVRSSPCVCADLAAEQRRVEACSRVP